MELDEDISRDLNNAWEDFKPIADITLDTLWSPFRDSSLGNRPLSEVYAEDLGVKCPHLKGKVDILSTGSREEGSWIAKFFKENDGELDFLLESDVMVYTQGQILEDENCLLNNEKRPGFVQLKNPRWDWTFPFYDEKGEYTFITYINGTEMINSSECIRWTHQISNACNPFHGEPNLLNAAMKMMNVRGINIPSMKDTSVLKRSGPSANVNIGTFTKQSAKVWFNLMSNVFVDPKKEQVKLLYDCFINCRETSKIIQNLLSGLLGGHYVIDLQNGLICQKSLQEKDGREMKNCGKQLVENIKAVCKAICSLASEDKDNYFPGIKRKITTTNQILSKIESHESYVHFTKSDSESFFLKSEYLLQILSDFENMKQCIDEAIFFTLAIYGDKDAFLKSLEENNFYKALSLETDFVFSVKCRFWPRVAQNWVIRKPVSKFPPEDVKDNIIKNGVLIVPKTFDGGNLDIDWRFSFSSAELELTHHQTKAQKIAYLLLKSIYYEQLYIPANYPGHGCLSSYSLKTIMMWACEEKEEQFWDEGNIAQCVLYLLNQLKQALEKKYLQHYFISECNILQDAEMDDIGKLLKKLTKVLENPSKYPRKHMIDEILKNVEMCNLFHSIYANYLSFMKLQFTDNFGIGISKIAKAIESSPLEKSMGMIAPGVPGASNILTTFLTGKDPSREYHVPSIFGISSDGIEDFLEYVIDKRRSISVEEVLKKKYSQSSEWMQLLIPEMKTLNFKEIQQMEKFETLVKNKYLLKLFDYLLANNLHIVLFAMCKHINYSKAILETISQTKILAYTRTGQDENDKEECERRNEAIIQAQNYMVIAAEHWNAAVRHYEQNKQNSRQNVQLLDFKQLSPNHAHFCILGQILQIFETIGSTNSLADMHQFVVVVLFHHLKMQYEDKLLEKFKSYWKKIENTPEKDTSGYSFQQHQSNIRQIRIKVRDNVHLRFREPDLD